MTKTLSHLGGNPFQLELVIFLVQVLVFLLQKFDLLLQLGDDRGPLGLLPLELVVQLSNLDKNNPFI